MLGGVSLGPSLFPVICTCIPLCDDQWACANKLLHVYLTVPVCTPKKGAVSSVYDCVVSGSLCIQYWLYINIWDVHKICTARNRTIDTQKNKNWRVPFKSVFFVVLPSLCMIINYTDIIYTMFAIGLTRSQRQVPHSLWNHWSREYQPTSFYYPISLWIIDGYEQI